MYIGDLTARIAEYAFLHCPEQREGQAYFNGLAEAWPEAADEIRGTDRDPFYNDDNIPAFFEYLAERAEWA